MKKHGTCRLQRAFAKHGGIDNVEKILKYWVLSGPTCTMYGDPKSSQLLHRDMPMPVVLPSLAALDKMPFADEAIEPAVGLPGPSCSAAEEMPSKRHKAV